MKETEALRLIEACAHMLVEQYVLPLTLALGTLTAVACRNRERADEIARNLRMQAANCPPDVAGKRLLLALAELAEAPDGLDAAAASSALHELLQPTRRESGG